MRRYLKQFGGYAALLTVCAASVISYRQAMREIDNINL